MSCKKAAYIALQPHRGWFRCACWYGPTPGFVRDDGTGILRRCSLCRGRLLVRSIHGTRGLPYPNACAEVPL